MNGQRSGQITFYDQLGVPSTASSEEIRDAYRALARLLHPDQHTDPNLKRIAEQQMRKLNPIYTILSDPERRRNYDEDLADDYGPPIILEGPPRFQVNRVLGRMVWVVAVLVGGGLLYWLAAGNSAGNPFASEQPEQHIITLPATPSSTDKQTADAFKIASLQSEVKTLTAERDFAMHELLRLKGVPTPSSEPTHPPLPSSQLHSLPARTITELPGAVKTLAATPAQPRSEPAAPKPTLAGFWFYSRPKDGQKNKNQTLYLPEYIEATITEQDGVLRGKYRSRFQIADRAMFPEVNFTFAGTPNGSVLTCPWSGQGGAKGELTLKLTSDNAVRIDWAASELGSQQALASGTAILTRRID
jgi:hypothetical protein